MRYQGGKTGTARGIAPIIQELATPGVTYFEPFLGGGAVASRIASAFGRAVLSDGMPDLMLMWQALAGGWEPPTHIPEWVYRELRHADPSALRGFVGFGCSFGGKWFGGYARPWKGVDYADQSSRNVLRKLREIGPHAEFIRQDYREVAPAAGDVVYLDPPYANTTSYAGTGKFDTPELWRWAEKWSFDGAHVFVSEYEAPDGWVPVWSRPRTRRMRGSGSQTDHLFVRVA